MFTSNTCILHNPTLLKPTLRLFAMAQNTTPVVVRFACGCLDEPSQSSNVGEKQLNEEKKKSLLGRLRGVGAKKPDATYGVPHYCDKCYARLNSTEQSYYAQYHRDNVSLGVLALRAPPARGVNETIAAVQLGQEPETIKSLRQAQEKSVREAAKEEAATVTFDNLVRDQKHLEIAADFWPNLHRMERHKGSKSGPLNCNPCNIQAGNIIKPCA